MICQAKIRFRSYEEQDKAVHEATHVGTAFVTKGEPPNGHVVPIAIVYGESYEEVKDRLTARAQEKGFEVVF